MSRFKGDREQPDKARYRPADSRTRGEVGGILERSFQREGGKEPNEEEARRLLALADEAEKRADAAESLAHEADSAAADSEGSSEWTGDAAHVPEAERLKEAAQIYRREAESLREEAERLRRYFF
jgi:hypothetical protein